MINCTIALLNVPWCSIAAARSHLAFNYVLVYSMFLFAPFSVVLFFGVASSDGNSVQGKQREKKEHLLQLVEECS